MMKVPAVRPTSRKSRVTARHPGVVVLTLARCQCHVVVGAKSGSVSHHLPAWRLSRVDRIPKASLYFVTALLETQTPSEVRVFLMTSSLKGRFLSSCSMISTILDFTRTGDTEPVSARIIGEKKLLSGNRPQSVCASTPDMMRDTDVTWQPTPSATSCIRSGTISLMPCSRKACWRSARHSHTRNSIRGSSQDGLSDHSHRQQPSAFLK